MSRGAKPEVGLDAVEGGGAPGAFYRVRGGAERIGWRRSPVQWGLKASIMKW
jgi:hypothetical protein